MRLCYYSLFHLLPDDQQAPAARALGGWITVQPWSLYYLSGDWAGSDEPAAPGKQSPRPGSGALWGYGCRLLYSRWLEPARLPAGQAGTFEGDDFDALRWSPRQDQTAH